MWVSVTKCDPMLSGRGSLGRRMYRYKLLTHCCVYVTFEHCTHNAMVASQALGAACTACTAATLTGMTAGHRTSPSLCGKAVALSSSKMDPLALR